MINRPAQDNSAFHAHPAHSNPTNERNETPNQTNRPVETGDCPHLDAGLKGTSDWWGIMDVAIGVNKCRENWFDMDNLRNNTNVRQMLQARGEGYMLRGMNSLIEALYQMLSMCDWGGVAECLGWQAAKMSLSELATWGICTYCTIAPEPITKITACGACITLNLATPVTTLATSINIVGCFTKNCGK